MMKLTPLVAVFIHIALKPVNGWTLSAQRRVCVALSAHKKSTEETDLPVEQQSSRRGLLQTAIGLAALQLGPFQARADGPLEPKVTDRIFLDVKGLPRSAEAAQDAPNTQRIVIGLYGDQAPSSVAKIKALASSTGLQASCRPRAERTLQKEQLEANKVFNSCKEGEEQGVVLRYSTIWRVVPNLRIDVGAVTGKFVAREFPNWNEDKAQPTMDVGQLGTVSVRRGNESGFGFTLSTGSGDNGILLDDMQKNHIVVGRVLEGLDVVQALNAVPVITTAKQVSYMAINSGNMGNTAPTRSCQYGGPLYCNENKPLVKLTVTEVGLLPRG